jgi:hypothetical protein
VMEIGGSVYTTAIPSTGLSQATLDFHNLTRIHLRWPSTLSAGSVANF